MLRIFIIFMWRDVIPQKSLNLRQAADQGVLGQAHDGKRVFLGMLDDSVTRYGWVGLKSNADTLNLTLIEGALLGTKSCARIGNILYHSDYLAALMGEIPSPIIPMMQSGFFQIQMLKPSINETIAERLKIGTNSTKVFVEKKDWHVGSDLYGELEKIDSSLTDGLGKVAYNGDFKPFFRIMMLDLCASLPAQKGDTKKIFETWMEEFSTPDQLALSRSNFEETAKRLKVDGEVQDIREAMWLANAANHYAYGAGMARDSQAGHVMVQTTPHQDLASICASGDSLDAERANEGLAFIEKDAVLAKLSTKLRIPRGIEADPSLWRKLADLVNEENDYSSAVQFRNAKAGLLNAIQCVFLDPGPQSRKWLNEKADYYSEKLYSGLGIKRSVGEVIGDKLSVIVSELKTRTAGELAGMAVDRVPHGKIIKHGVEMAFKLIPDGSKKTLGNFYNSVFHASVTPTTDFIAEGLRSARNVPFGSVTASQSISQAAVAELGKKIR